MRTFLVIGSAPGLFEDVTKALQLRPFAEGILVNGACAALDWPEHQLCGHEEKTAQFVAARLAAFPNRPCKYVHATYPKLGGPKPDDVRKAEYARMFPQVTNWWPLDMGGHAGSAGKAINIARALGADEVILCGCPYDGSGYFEGEGKGISQSMNCLRIGDGGLARGYPKPGTDGREWMRVQDTRIVKGYREHFARLAKTVFASGVFSMSGFTRECVGEPPRN